MFRVADTLELHRTWWREQRDSECQRDNPKVRRVLGNVGLRREWMEELKLSVKTKRRASEKGGRSECKFRLITRLGNTWQVSTAYILFEVPCSIRGSGVSSIKCSEGNDRWRGIDSLIIIQALENRRRIKVEGKQKKNNDPKERKWHRMQEWGSNDLDDLDMHWMSMDIHWIEHGCDKRVGYVVEDVFQGQRE